MSGFGAVVVLPPMPPADVAVAVGEAMRPFRIDEITGRGEWDHYLIDGELLVRPERADDPAIIRVSPRGDRPSLECDGGPKGMLDFPAMRAVAATRARDEWTERQAAARRGVPEYPPGYFGDDEQAYVERQKSEVGVSTAMVTLDGRWIEGPVGEDRSDWTKALRLQAEYLAALDDDAIIVHLACHG